MKKLKDIMTREVESVSPGTPIREAARMMKAGEFGSLPVCEDGRLLGTITDRDITIQVVAEGRDPSQTPARDVMNKDVLCCTEEETLADATRVMEKQRVHRVFVVDAGSRLVGIVSLGKVARAGDETMAGQVVKRISRPRKVS